MPRYNLWIDFETTGLDTAKCGILQFAYIIEDQKTHEVVKRNKYIMRPFEGAEFEDYAMEMSGMTITKAKNQGAKEDLAMIWFLKEIAPYVNKMDKNSFFTPAAYNSPFDMAFLKSWFEREGVEFKHYFTHNNIDPLALMRILQAEGVYPGKSLKLANVYKAMFGGDVSEAHNAAWDVEAARKIYRAITAEYFEGNKDEQV